MLFIARGRGILVGLIAFASLVAAELLTEWRFHDDTYYQSHGWPKLAGFAVAAFIVWLIGPHDGEDVSSGVKPTPFDDRPGRSILRDTDSFFFIPIRYWPWILCAIGVAIFLAAM